MNLTENNNESSQTNFTSGQRLATLIRELGYSQRDFARKLGFKHPSTVYAVIKGRNISPSLMKKIKEFYYLETKKQINPRWILDGTNPRLLTDDSDSLNHGLLEEGQKKYQNKCLDCIKKDIEIKYLQEECDRLNDKIFECLKEVSALKHSAFG